MDEENSNGHQPPPPNIKKPSVPPPNIGKPTQVPPPVSAPEPEENTKNSPLQVKVTPDGEIPPPENKEPAVPLTTRAAAAGIDFAIALGLYLAVIIVAAMTFDFLGKLAWLVFMSFIVTRDGLPFLKGQSPGKTAMKIKAVTTSGDNLAGNWEPALIRNAVLLIPLFPIVELVVLINREDKKDQGKRLGDEWAGTKIVPVVDVHSEEEMENGEEVEASS